MKYKDIDDKKKAFVLELDNVIYPEKDYLFQVYYLFSSFLEYTELINAKDATDLMIATYLKGEKDKVFDMVKEKFPSLVRVKCELDKEAIIAMREEQQFQDLQKTCFVDVVQDETFFVEAKLQSLLRVA